VSYIYPQNIGVEALNSGRILQAFCNGMAVVVTLGMVWVFASILFLGAPTQEVELTSPVTEGQNLPITRVATQSTPTSSPTTAYLFVIGALSLTVFVSVAITFYLYRWRRILQVDNKMLVPEELGAYLIDVKNGIFQLSTIFSEYAGKIADETAGNSKKIESMTNTYMQLQDVLNEKDDEIRRLRRGYDADIFRRFIKRFARIEESVEDFLVDDQDSQMLLQFQRLFEDAFDECGLTKFLPSVGGDYRKEVGVTDNPRVEPTENIDEDFQIFEILQPGYMISSDDAQEIIISSKVKIYRFKGVEKT
jgi:hypothetical protein